MESNKSQSKVKAVFVGITYTKTTSGLVTLLGTFPYRYAKSLMENLILKGAFMVEQCLFLTDKDWDGAVNISNVGKVVVKMPSKENVTGALIDIIDNANKAGDSLLFFYSGHGAAYNDSGEFYQHSGHWGLLKTLDEDGKNVVPLFDTEFRDIIGALPPKVNLTMLVQACHGGVMFVTPTQPPSKYKGKGIALTSVDPTIPASIEGPAMTSDRRDFATFLNDIILQFPKGEKSKWPTYSEIFAKLHERAEAAARFKEKEFELKPQLYFGQPLDPSLRFLEEPPVA